jgi:ribosomal protein L11 methylase PrmA
LQVIVIRPRPSRVEHLLVELWEHGTVGILEEDDRLRAYFPDSLDLSGVVTPENGEVTECLVEDGCPSHDANEANSEPVSLGRQFVVLTGCGVWAPDRSRIPLRLPTTDAFGSGRHESTQLMVEAMEEYLHPGRIVVDVGCGSGILSAVACHLGASTVIACDIHIDVVRTARRTCMEAAAFVGSVDAVEPFAADFVLANISAKVIDALAADLVRATQTNGLLLLSGFIQDRTPQRFRPEKVLEQNGWLCWICRPELVPDDSPESRSPVQPFEVQWW